MAYDGDQPVGWCSFGPLAQFPRIQRQRRYPKPGEPGHDPDVWSINCFFIVGRYRGRGVARGLLTAALDAIRARGGRLAEAYPVRRPAKIFEEAGFREVARLSPTRTLPRRGLRPRRARPAP